MGRRTRRRLCTSTAPARWRARAVPTNSPGLSGNFIWDACNCLAHHLCSGEANCCCCCAAAPAAAMSWRRLFFPLANRARPAASSSRRLFVGVVASEPRSDTAAGRAGRLTSNACRLFPWRGWRQSRFPGGATAGRSSRKGGKRPRADMPPGAGPPARPPRRRSGTILVAWAVPWRKCARVRQWATRA